jgi:hypothetical protein
MLLKTFFRRLFPVKSMTDFPGGFIPCQYILRGPAAFTGKALVLGDLNGRDYHLLKKYFCDVKSIDIVDNNVIPLDDLIIQDASKVTSLSSGSFSYIVACNIIEHMYGDYDCICEMNRLLEDHGRLFIDCPFFSCKPFFHFRIYSPRVFLRMLEHAGFSNISLKYRGFVSFISPNTVSLMAVLLFPLFRENALLKANKLIFRLQESIENSYFLNSLNSNHFGGYMLFEKVSSPSQGLEIQSSHFKL